MTRMTKMEINVPDEVADVIKSLLAIMVNDGDLNDLFSVNSQVGSEITRQCMLAILEEDDDYMQGLARYLIATYVFCNNILESLDPVIVKEAQNEVAEKVAEFNELTARPNIQDDFFKGVNHD